LTSQEIGGEKEPAPAPGVDEAMSELDRDESQEQDPQHASAQGQPGRSPGRVLCRLYRGRTGLPVYDPLSDGLIARWRGRGMRKAGIVAAVAVVVVAGAYLAGYLPEHRARISGERELTAVREELSAAEQRVRLSELLGRALMLKEAAQRQNYGQALEFSSAFFDAVLAEMKRATQGERAALAEILAMRDGVTAALAKADPTIVDALHRVELRLRQALAYPVPG
jgi:hypothetical protein